MWQFALYSSFALGQLQRSPIKTVRGFSFLLTCVLVCLPMGNTCQAQRPTEVGESVKVLVFNDWIDGVVVDQKKKQILVEYYWGGSAKQKVFERREVLRLYEDGCLDFGRVWESSAGTKIEAALKAVEGNNLTLVRPNLEEVVVPMDKLSSRDQAYAKKVAKNLKQAIDQGNVAPPTPELPELEQFATQYGSYSMFAEAGRNVVQPLGSVPSFLEFEQAGAGIELVRREQELDSVIPVGGPDQLVLMGTRENYMGNDPFPSQLYWVSLKKRKVISKIYVTPAHMAMDYDPRTKLLLTFHPNSFFDDNGAPSQYVLWDLKPGGDKPTPVARWEVETSKEVFLNQYFAKIIDKDTVVTKVGRQTFAAWNIPEKKEIYRFQTQSFFDAPSVLTRDRKHIIVPEDRQISIVDAKTGQFTMNLTVNDSHVSGANINPAGTKLAAITERNLLVWDLTKAKDPPKIYPAPLMSSPFKARLDWIDDDHVLGESYAGRVLYSLKLQLPVWSYSVDTFNRHENRDPLKNFVLNGMYFYVARPTLSNIIAVGAIKMPGPSVQQVLSKVEREDVLILKPGVKVGLDLSNISDTEQVRTWLLEEIKRNGWIYDPTAEIRVDAMMGRGETQSVAYQSIDGAGGIERATFRPYFSRVQVLNGQQLLWSAASSSGAPAIIRGGNAQAQVERLQQPNLQFFEKLDIAHEVVDPKYGRGFGKSEFGLRGLRVTSMEPPGRDDDPYAAEREADKQRQDARNNQSSGNNSSDGNSPSPFGGNGGQNPFDQ